MISEPPFHLAASFRSTYKPRSSIHGGYDRQSEHHPTGQSRGQPAWSGTTLDLEETESCNLGPCVRPICTVLCMSLCVRARTTAFVSWMLTRPPPGEQTSACLPLMTCILLFLTRINWSNAYSWLLANHNVLERLDFAPVALAKSLWAIPFSRRSRRLTPHISAPPDLIFIPHRVYCYISLLECFESSFVLK